MPLTTYLNPTPPTSVLAPKRSLGEVTRILFDAARSHRTGIITPVASSVAQQATFKGLALMARLFFPKGSIESQLKDFRAVLSSLRPDDVSPYQRYPLSMFRGLNTRGIQDYSSILFEGDLIEKSGLPLKPEQTVLWKLIENLPHGATVADWGGGAGIFGYELKQRRSDLKVYVNDLYRPEAIMEQEGAEAPLVSDLRTNLTYLTGDALITTLPERKKADLIVSALLTPYLKDPLKLIPHLYNQLRTGGLLVLSMTPDIYPAEQRDASSGLIISEVVRELRKMGVQAEEIANSKTLLIRKLQRNDMKLMAHCVANHYGETRVGRYLTFYRPATSETNRWFQLI